MTRFARRVRLGFGTALTACSVAVAADLFLGSVAVSGALSPAAHADSTANSPPAIVVRYPGDGALFPPESLAPTFKWDDPAAGVDSWRIDFQFEGDAQPLSFTARTPEWIPDKATWEMFKRRSVETPIRIAISGFNSAQGPQPLSRGGLKLATSRDEVGAPLFYREVNLPFQEAVKDPSQIRWRFGPISSPTPPPVVLEHLPVCGNCHSFSKDGGVFGMDVDYANSKGSYVVTRTAEKMTLATSDIMTWDDYKREDGQLTFGLLSQLSPDGTKVISTVKDRSVFVPKPDLAFSQLFFPIKGILAVYNRATRTFKALKGADDPQFVQSNPVWSPDGKDIVFARTRAYHLKNESHSGTVLLTPEECKEFLEEQKPFRFDLYRIPYNDGEGGTAEPLAGASDDGLSNFFPKFSPDGKWIVFCKARNYMLLQPDSELYIIPASGGVARRLRANTIRMNSWHSWSPNGRWLVFSSKANSPYTQLFLTHIDEEGNSTPAILLSQMTDPGRAANIPEFVNLTATGIHKIQEQFLDDYSFERAGNEFYKSGETDQAIRKYRQALELNAGNVTAHQRLGFLLYHVKRQFEEGLAHSQTALRLDSNNVFARCDLGVAFLHQGRAEEAIQQLSEACRFNIVDPEPRYQPQAIRFSLAQAYLAKGRVIEAVGQLTNALQTAPDFAEGHYLLALVLASQGEISSVTRHYAKAVALKPGLDTSINLHDMLALNYAKAGQFPEAISAAGKAAQIAHATGNDDRATQIEARIKLYRAGKMAPP